MSRWMLAAGAAALAIVSPVLAQKGGHGGGNDKGGGHAAKAEHGGNQAMKADRGNGGGQAMRVEHGHGGGGGHAMRAEHQPVRQFVQREQHGHGGGNDHVRAARDNHQDRVDFRDGNRGNDVRIAQVNRGDEGARFVPRWNNHGLVRGFVDGCPPGLAKKGNGCMPPGQARKLVGTVLPTALSNNMLGGPFSQWYRDNDDYYYRNDADYIYRVRRDGGLIDALFPSSDRDYYYYPVGMNYPSDYDFYNVPYQYSSYYPDGGDYSYRYGDGAIYQVNRSNGLIEGISALLAGDLGVGQRLPPGYGAYNVPLDYRDRYYDTADNMYRYNDGYIYRVDPTTQMITAVINALV